MRRSALAAAVIALSALPALGQEATKLQPLVDAAPEGAILKLAPGRYLGPVVIAKALTIDGDNKASVSGEGVGTVFTLNGRQITLERLRIENSGRRHENLDACLRLENAVSNVVKDNELRDCLVGIDLRQADGNVIRRNRVQGAEPDLDIRGDGIRVWRSNGNTIENNVVVDHRDVLIEYSTGNTFSGNSVTNGRYGTHFMYASGNVARGNFYAYNTVGLFSMYSNELCLIDNRITYGNGPDGIGIGLKEASALRIENNEILGNAVGLYLDDSPFDTDKTNLFRGNRFAFNALAVQFHSNGEGNTFAANAFLHNYTDVSARGGDGATATQWRGNSWDASEGVDRQGRGVGDTPFEIYAYADQLWSDVPMAAFFRGSPVFESIDFLSRLAPFSKPRLVLRDEAPVLRPDAPPPDCGM